MRCWNATQWEILLLQSLDTCVSTCLRKYHTEKDKDWLEAHCSRIFRHDLLDREARPEMDTDSRLLGYRTDVCHHGRRLQSYWHSRQICLPRLTPGKVPSMLLSTLFQPKSSALSREYFSPLTTITHLTVLLQFWRQLHHLHHRCRSLPHARPWLCARCQRCYRQTRCYHFCTLVQLPQRTKFTGSGECSVDFLCLLRSRGGNYLVPDPWD